MNIMDDHPLDIITKAIDLTENDTAKGIALRIWGALENADYEIGAKGDRSLAMMAKTSERKTKKWLSESEAFNEHHG